MVEQGLGHAKTRRAADHGLTSALAIELCSGLQKHLDDARIALRDGFAERRGVVVLLVGVRAFREHPGDGVRVAVTAGRHERAAATERREKEEEA